VGRAAEAGVSFRFQPLGADGARQRMQEIQERIQQLTDKAGQGSSFQGELVRLTGEIGNDGFEPYRPFGAGAVLQPLPTPEELRPMIESAARRHGIDPSLLDSVVANESNYDSRARSRAGAMGLTQLMPGTAAELGVKDPFDPFQSLDGGAKYLRQMIDRYGGDLSLALAAYNAGPGTVDRSGGVPRIDETRNYIDRVLRRYRERSGL
jgi:soluble lytic murein transglycosylase-like protein